MTTKAKVCSRCMLLGVKVYIMDYTCAGIVNYNGHCPATTGLAQEDWKGSFCFDVPAIVQTFDYWSPFINCVRDLQ